MSLNIDHSRINAAIAQAETTTSGEITCVIKAKAFDYPETPLAWGFGVALLLPLALAAFGISLEDTVAAKLPAAISTWEAAHAGVKTYNRLQELGLYGLIQLCVFVVTYLIVRFTPLALFLTPKSTKLKRAHEKAREQFYARGLHLTTGHTGVMIFCALQEHFVEVIADEGIYSKVDATVWNDAVDVLLKHTRSGDLTKGFEAAIAAVNVPLSAHFPPGASNPNELPDVLIEI